MKISKNIKTNVYTTEIIKAIEKFELQTLYDTGLENISGGFALADAFDYDDDYIYIELKWGIQNDCENTVHTEQWKLNRKTMEFDTA